MIRIVFTVALVLLVAWWVYKLAMRLQAKVRGTPLSGKLVEYHPNGRVSVERMVRDGMMDGPWMTWDADGNKLAEGAYEKGIVHGTEVDYGANGVKVREVQWAHGRRHGTARVWDTPDGEPRLLCYVHADDDKAAHDGACSRSEEEAPPPN